MLTFLVAVIAIILIGVVFPGLIGAVVTLVSFATVIFLIFKAGWLFLLWIFAPAALLALYLIIVRP